MEPARADPTPCERCRHRRDMHELSRGMLMCRACNYIGPRWPCSPAILKEEAVLAALNFERE
jgi:hypothetical protein